MRVTDCNKKILSRHTEENEAVQMSASFLFHMDRLAKADYWDWAAQKRGIFFFFLESRFVFIIQSLKLPWKQSATELWQA